MTLRSCGSHADHMIWCLLHMVSDDCCEMALLSCNVFCLTGCWYLACQAHFSTKVLSEMASSPSLHAGDQQRQGRPLDAAEDTRAQDRTSTWRVPPSAESPGRIESLHCPLEVRQSFPFFCICGISVGLLLLQTSASSESAVTAFLDHSRSYFFFSWSILMRSRVPAIG